MTIKKSIVYGLLLGGICALGYFGYRTSHTRHLAIYGPSDFNPTLVATQFQESNKDYTVADFSLINQNGEIITQEHFKNKVYVTDFFFTRCPSICPIMTNNMGKLQEVFKEDDAVLFLSLSVTPELDSVPVLRKYANTKGIIDGKWHITTGDKKHIYNLARKSYFSALDEGDGGLQDFIHTTQFVLVDTEKRIRGVYDGLQVEEMDRLIADIKLLVN